MSDIERSQMHFALGKAYEVKKDFDKSFKNYYEGNKVKKGLIKYSSDDTTENTKKILDFFNKENIQNFSKSSTKKSRSNICFGNAKIRINIG